MIPDPAHRDADSVAYVEGRLGEEARRAFEAEMAAAPVLRERVETLRQADAALRRRFPAPAAFDLRRPARRLPLRRGLIGIAAVLGIALGAWRLVSYYAPGPPAGYERTPLGVYDRLVARGFQPEWVCKDDAEFIATVQDAFGEGLLARSGGGVEIVGWAYAGGLTELGLGPEARLLLARVDGDPVLVFLDRFSTRRRLKFQPPRERSIHLFERRMGGLVLYELTPRPCAGAVDRFEVAG